jgi:competence protein ComEC
MKTKAVGILLLVLVFFAGCGETARPARPVPASGSIFTVSFLDVGQADAILVSDGEHAALVDAGNNGDGNDVVEYIRSRGLTKLDFAIGTHPDEDHVGGLDTVMRSIETDTLIIPEKAGTTNTYRDVLAAAQDGGVRVTAAEAGSEYDIGSFRMSVFGPVKTYSDTNSNSVVVKITYGNTSFLMTGDIEQDAERDIVSMGYDLECDVLKAAHHGSETSSSYIFLRAANPRMVVISCGADNQYGHPHEAALSRYRDLGATVYRTDTMGTVIMESNGETITVNAAGDESPREHVAGIGGNGLAEDSEIVVSEYIGNINSKKFHLPACRSLPAEKNRIIFESRKDAVDGGYSPCAICNP